MMTRIRIWSDWGILASNSYACSRCSVAAFPAAATGGRDAPAQLS
jgi:hypothetical protein